MVDAPGIFCEISNICGQRIEIEMLHLIGLIMANLTENNV
jgi:hypothetical protein